MLDQAISSQNTNPDMITYLKKELAQAYKADDTYWFLKVEIHGSTFVIVIKNSIILLQRLDMLEIVLL